MADIALFDLVALSLLYAVTGTGILAGLGLSAGLQATRRLVPTAFLVLFFVALTQLPLPDLEDLVRRCPLPHARPNFVAFDFIFYVANRWQRFGTLRSFVMEWSAVVFAMNFVLCVMVGLVASRHLLPAAALCLLGLGLSTVVEFTQLTGGWGHYPCAWRKFDVDDILLNTAGVTAGVLLGRRLGLGSGHRRPA